MQYWIHEVSGIPTRTPVVVRRRMRGGPADLPRFLVVGTHRQEPRGLPFEVPGHELVNDLDEANRRIMSMCRAKFRTLLDIMDNCG